MGWLDDQISDQFWTWEALGRGVLTFPEPVSPSPPFVPFTGYRLPQTQDDGRRPGLLERMSKAFRSEPPPLPEVEDEEPEPNWRGEKEFCETLVLLPESFKADSEVFGRMLANMQGCCDAMAFEIVGAPGRVVCQLATSVDDAASARRQLTAHFPEASFVPCDGNLASAWLAENEAHSAIVEFALCREFMLPLARSKTDPFVGLVGALSDLGDGEAGVYQVIFEPLAEPWAESAFAAVADGEGKPIFDDRPELVKAAADKLSQPLYGAVVRIAARSVDFHRAWEIAREMASALRVFSWRNGNELFPLPNDNYPHDEHERDLLMRQTRRSGMILNVDELIGFAHFPTAAVRSPVFARFAADTRPASIARRDGVFLGFNEHAGETREVWLDAQSRLRHCHIIGGTGTGKSTLMLSMIAQDIEHGEGFALLDPHGDLVDAVMGLIPPERAGDVVLLDPSDEQFVVPFNILSAHSDFEKQLLASDLVSVFQRLSTSWGDQMQVVMQNAVLAFLESDEGGTLADVRRFLIDAAWRERFLRTVADADVRFYWRSAFPQLGGGRSIGPILTRLETFLSPKPIRYMVSQRENRLDFDAIMGGGKIFLAKLPQGVIGRENAFLLGSLLMTKLQQAAMGRARMSAAERVPFHCYIDEFQHFITPSLTEILSGARKYGLGLVLAHQELKQLERDRDMASAVLANAFTRVVFRVSDSDARTLAEGFAHFEARHLQSLGTGEALCRIGSAGNDFNLSVPLPPEIDEEDATANRAAVIEVSRATYAMPRSEIEAEMLRRLEAEEVAQPPRRAKPAPVSEPLAVTKSDTKSAAEVVNETSEHTEAAEPPAEVNQAAPTSAGMGRGGLDHQFIVEQLAVDAIRFGYRATKEFAVPDGRVDIALEKRERRIAIEVAVNTNTAHEMENILKCFAGGFDHVVSLSPLPNVLENIRRAAGRRLPSEQLSRMQFHAPGSFLAWLEVISASDAESVAQPSDEMRTYGGRRVRIKRVELAPDERARLEKEHLAAIAEILSSSSTTSAD
ncbi:MAG: type IV secretion system DNA-binding domain-containing protein [Verrucomicrobiaceae bacterium]|nr:type IV secretion system DNA-binding domain-containing protein [Verrucomicrobiaceae bacterium]